MKIFFQMLNTELVSLANFTYHKSEYLKVYFQFFMIRRKHFKIISGNRGK